MHLSNDTLWISKTTNFSHSYLKLCLIFSSLPFSWDALSLAVDIEHEVFKSSKSSNLYKASVLKKVNAVLLLLYGGCVPDAFRILKVADMKKAAPASAGEEREEDDKIQSSTDTRDSTLKEEASSSSSFTDELQGFTSASEIYSVRSF